MDVLRLSTAGSVDDGKSSLIGRLLFDTKSILEDQYAAIERASLRRGSGQVELALLTDGLRAEREQNITIDVAYRYFSTPRRKFIIADTPGHVQYTRNMVTGTSTADVSVVLVDATKGVLTQSRRHAAVSALLKVPQLVIAVNKMDLVDYRQERFEEIRREFQVILDQLGVENATFVPVSALLGDNVVDRGERMTWYDGPTLLGYLEESEVGVPASKGPFRMPVQVVIRPDDSFRGVAGTILSGSLAVGDRIGIHPSGTTTRAKSIRGANGPIDSAGIGTPVVVEFTDEIDASRGALLASAEEPPTSATQVEATVAWMSERPLEVGQAFYLLHTTRRLSAWVTEILGRIDLEEMVSRPATKLEANDLGRVRIRLTDPIFGETYENSRELGSFVLVEPGDHATVAAGMIDRLSNHATGEAFAVRWLVGGKTDERAEALSRWSTAFGTRPRLAYEGSDLLGVSGDLAGLRRLVLALAKQADVSIGLDEWPAEFDEPGPDETIDTLASAKES